MVELILIWYIIVYKIPYRTVINGEYGKDTHILIPPIEYSVYCDYNVPMGTVKGRPMVPQCDLEYLNGSIVLVNFMVFLMIETQIFPRNRRVHPV